MDYKLIPLTQGKFAKVSPNVIVQYHGEYAITHKLLSKEGQ